MLGTNELLDGAVDLHVHPAPSPFPRRLGVYDAITEAADAGFAAIAVKSHHHSMSTDVLAVTAAVGKLPLTVLSGVCLNNEVGGLNPYAVELMLNQGGRLVWFPTLAARKHLDVSTALHTFPVSSRPLRPQRVVPVLDDSRQLLAAAGEILELIADADAILSCGHLDADEIDVLIEAAQRCGVSRIMVNHPNFVIGADARRCAGWAQRGVFIEHSLCHYVQGSSMRKFSLDTLLDYVSQVGVSQTILSSDLGQVGNPTPVEAFGWLVDQLVAHDVDPATIRRLVSGSAQALIG
jgi:hypothetical protein